MTTSITLSREEIESRVNGTNKFSKAEITAYKGQIAKARKARRERLGGMTIAMVTAKVSAAMEAGFVIEDDKERPLKSKDVWQLKFSRSKGAQGLKAQNAALEQQIAELRAQLSRMTGQFRDVPRPVEA